MANKEYRTFNGEFKYLQKKNEFIYEVEIWLLNDKTTRNGWRYTDMRGNKNQFVGTPILIAYTQNGKRIGDGHNFRMEYDEEGREAPSFTDATAERIIGSMSDRESDIRIEVLEDGTEWIVGEGYIWKWYAKEAVEKIENDTEAGRPMSISIETLVTMSHDEDGVEVEDEYTVLGTTILGDGVAPAVKDARILAINELASEFKELKIRAASYIAENADEENEKEEEVIVEATNLNKAQTKSKEGEEKTLNVFSKKQVAELAKKFDGYTVLSAGQDDTGIHVALMGEDSSTAVYTLNSLEDTIVPENFVKVNAQVTFGSDEWNIQVDSCDMTDDLTAKLIKANADLEKANADLSVAKETIAEMTNKEMKRRVSAAKAKAESTLANFNANREEKISETILEKINESIDKGDFSGCENAEGEWCGEEEVMNKVLAACAAEVMEQDKKAALARNAQFVWDGVAHGAQNADDVSSLLSQFGIN